MIDKRLRIRNNSEQSRRRTRKRWRKRRGKRRKRSRRGGRRTHSTKAGQNSVFWQALFDFFYFHYHYFLYTRPIAPGDLFCMELMVRLNSSRHRQIFIVAHINSHMLIILSQTHAMYIKPNLQMWGTQKTLCVLVQCSSQSIAILTLPLFCFTLSFCDEADIFFRSEGSQFHSLAYSETKY